MPHQPKTFQETLSRLQEYWAAQGCVLVQPYDLPIGAATFHPETFLRSLGAQPWRCAYAQACRRPSDGRYGENPNRLQQYYQFQVVLKPSPDDVQDLYLASLEALGIDGDANDVRFVEDDWESPTLGAWGLGWEVWLNGMEISQFTYFQQVGGLECRPVTGEITYGLERLAMNLQGSDDVFDIVWSQSAGRRVLYRDLFQRNEAEQSAYNFDEADAPALARRFDESEGECRRLLAKALVLPAYEQLMLASHCFNLLDARRAVSVTERQRYVLRTRKLALAVARRYCEPRE